MKPRFSPIFNHKGFSLIELLLVTALLSIICLTSSFTIVQGVKLYQRLSKTGQEKNMSIFLEGVYRDLRNMNVYSKVPFESKTNSITYAMAYNFVDGTGIPDARLAEVTLSYDADKEQVIRVEKRFATFETSVAISEKIIAQGVKSFNIKLEKDLFEIPTFIQIEIEFLGQFGLRRLSKSVLIPSASAMMEGL
ncbi:MAG: prepilin-type N-terminal cleavage/methylation domain-containing protein [Candidatus Omnitrophota bacterium]|jgi:prepilin-type N-terminal cleavage/methylation domain-containing protein